MCIWFTCFRITSLSHLWQTIVFGHRLNSYERVTHDSKYDSLLGVINSQGKKCKLVSGDGINPYRRDPENISILKPFTEYVQWFQSVNNRACMLSHVRLFVTLWTVGSPPGSSVHGISPARILEWVTMPSSRVRYNGYGVYFEIYFGLLKYRWA